MSNLNKEAVLKALESVTDGESLQNVVESGIVSSIVIRGNTVGFAIEVDMSEGADKEYLRNQCEAAVRKIKGVEKVTAVLTSNTPGILSTPKKPAPLPNQTVGNDFTSKAIPGVKHIIAVASGKGGVGKSTVAVNLARALADSGAKTGIVDVDIYGPSVPKMLGISGKPEVDEKNRIIPKEADGVKSVSIGYLVDEGNSVVWRSSMALKAMNQLMRGVAWGELDYLVIDTPPGTGDIQLSLSKNFNIAGVVLVSTPQEIALLDVKKAASMFGKVNVPIIGVVENMSYFEDDTGKKNYIFGRGSVEKFAKDSGISFLGEIPMRSDIREASDKGEKLTNFPAMTDIAEKIKSLTKSGL